MNYSQSEINSMRNDALRRTREMHSRANNENYNVQAEYFPPHSAADEKDKKNKDPFSDLLSGLLSKGSLDSDKIIIIILIVILAREGADLKLLIALGYVIM